MIQRLFQDAAGTIPAILAGQPVGLVKRMAGDVDASQAVVAAKPTLARWPMSGRRNFMNGSDAFSLTAYWFNSISGVGITGTLQEVGVEDGYPYADYLLTGTATATGAINLYSSARGLIPKNLRPVTMSIVGRILSGEVPAGCGFRATVTAGDAFGASLTGTQNSPISASTSDVVQSTTVTSDLNSDAVTYRAGVTFVVLSGLTVNILVRVKRAQFEVGSTITAHQFNYGPNDITEPNVKDLWHLYNDGGDSLTITLPAGTYGVQALDVDRGYRIDTIVSDGVTPITVLSAERQVDAIYRLGAFSPEEQRDTRKYWEKEYPL